MTYHKGLFPVYIIFIFWKPLAFLVTNTHRFGQSTSKQFTRISGEWVLWFIKFIYNILRNRDGTQIWWQSSLWISFLCYCLPRMYARKKLRYMPLDRKIYDCDRCFLPLFLGCVLNIEIGSMPKRLTLWLRPNHFIFDDHSCSSACPLSFIINWYTRWGQIFFVSPVVTI